MDKMRIGRYSIKFGSRCWIQTNVPVEVRCILGLIWVFREAKPTDIDSKQRFPLGTIFTKDGKRYHYGKKV